MGDGIHQLVRRMIVLIHSNGPIAIRAFGSDFKTAAVVRKEAFLDHAIPPRSRPARRIPCFDLLEKPGAGKRAATSIKANNIKHGSKDPCCGMPFFQRLIEHNRADDPDRSSRGNEDRAAFQGE